MGSFIKQHWLVYVIGIALAILVGLGASYALGAKWSTPENVRKERIAAEQKNKKAADNMADLIDPGSSANEGGEN